MKVFKKGRRNHSSEVVKRASAALECESKKERTQIASEDAILSIKKQIVLARGRGMTWQEIAITIQNAGMNVSISTLKKVAGKTEKQTETRQIQKKTAAPAPAPASVSVAARVRADVQKQDPAAPAPAVVVTGGFKVDLTSAADI